MAMLGVIAQANEAPNPILPSSNETLWGAVFVLAPMIVLIVLVVLAARYFQRLRRAVEDAATRAGAAEREVVALRAELRGESA
jgi:CHASE2 domain-containing sensor protein